MAKVRNIAGVKLKLNSKTIGRMLDGDLGIREELHKVATKTLAAARSYSPLLTGGYRESLHVFEAHTDRLAVRVGSDAPHAMAVEARHGVLANALAAGEGGAERVRYTTKAGKTIWATRAQVDHWTRGRR